MEEKELEQAPSKKRWHLLDERALSNLMVVLVGILFYVAMVNFGTLREKISGVFQVFTPFVAGFVIAYLLNPPTKFFETKVYRKLKARRGLAVLTVYLLALAFLALLLNIVLPQVGDSFMTLVGNMSIYAGNWNDLVKNALKNETVETILSILHIEENSISDLFVSYQGLIKQVTDFISQKLPELLSIGVALGSGVVSGLVAGITALISSVYMLLGRERLIPQVRKLLYAALPAKAADRLRGICGQANEVFSGFINGKLIDSAIIGVLCFILNLIFRIPYNILIAVVIGVTNVIPFFGPIIGAVPCILILLMVDPWAALRFAILVVALQQFDGNILGPKILGSSTGLSAIWVLVAIVVGGGLFGFAGMLLGVPTFAVIYALTREWANARLAKKGINSRGEPVAPVETPPDPEGETPPEA